MARRDMLSHSVWLRRLDGEEADGRKAPPTDTIRDGVAALMERINRMGYLVETWLEGSAVRCRMYPVAPQLPLGQPPVSLSYSGASLWHVLAAGTMDLSALSHGERRYHVATREHVRWAA